jgi:hypothetical protein
VYNDIDGARRDRNAMSMVGIVYFESSAPWRGEKAPDDGQGRAGPGGCADRGHCLS